MWQSYKKMGEKQNESWLFFLFPSHRQAWHDGGWMMKALVAPHFKAEIMLFTYTDFDLSQERRQKKDKVGEMCCRKSKIVVPLHRQKVNRLFRLVVIDLGF